MLPISAVRISILNLVIMVCFTQVSYAQSRAFPAFSPETETASEAATPAKPAARFPTTETAAEPESAPTARTSMFPVENISFPTGEAPRPVLSSTGKPLTFESLGSLLKEGLSLEASPVENRHDFLYRAELENQELELFFSVAMNADQSLIRVRAWLDPLPAGAISEEPLLKLLNRNIELSSGLHYGYSQPARRFLIETVLKNDRITAEVLKTALNEVSREVASSWALWTTSEWSTGPKRIAEKPELDSRNNAFSNDQFEMPVRR